MAKNFPSHPRGEITPMVIAGGNKNSATGTSERQDGAAPVFDVMRHSQQDVNLEDLWFSGLSQVPTAFGQNGFTAPPDPGTIVYVLKQAGEPGGVILGMSNTVRKGGEGSSGWVDCNTCRTDKETGRKKCKPCGRQSGEKRGKYPRCRPTPSQCKGYKRRHSNLQEA